MSRFTVDVNGTERTVEVAADTPLIYVLRNELRLTATRLGCGMSQCGACAVLADGKEVRSCTTTISQVAGRKIRTVEGLPGLWAEKKGLPVNSETLHPIQEAWIEEQVPQCGYCQSGMMIAAAELLERIPDPTPDQIRDLLTSTPPSAHLCRCGTYCGIVAAVQRAAKSMAV